MKSSSGEKWLDVSQKELQNMQANETWTLVKAPYDKKIVPGKWLLKIKRNEFGVVESTRPEL